jgi:hypothetical protein
MVHGSPVIEVSLTVVSAPSRARRSTLEEREGGGMARIDVLRPYVEKIVAEYLELDGDLVVDDDGTIPIHRGSARYVVRLLDAQPSPIVQVYSSLLSGVKRSSKLLAKLNEINADIWFGRMFHLGDQVIVAVEMVAETLDKEELAAACDAIGAIADARDTELHDAFGGSMAFTDEPAQTADGETPAEV